MSKNVEPRFIAAVAMAGDRLDGLHSKLSSLQQRCELLRKGLFELSNALHDLQREIEGVERELFKAEYAAVESRIIEQSVIDLGER